ncbi:GIY-YIG nuclease family protein [Halopenitus sp. H-Gu1]|uniref:GIY-YIG nuclease family protein n=1 Tax=Halopenitus sp. H-Gu1 TaxID=3242697 RepID=UPI00359E31B1
MGLEDFHPDDVLEYADKLQDEPVEGTVHPGVYVIYDGISGEPLYVGETKNVYQRLYDHHCRLKQESKTIRELVEDDSKLERETEQGRMWEWTEWSWVNIEEDKTKRQNVERVVENRLKPRYPSD